MAISPFVRQAQLIAARSRAKAPAVAAPKAAAAASSPAPVIGGPDYQKQLLGEGQYQAEAAGLTAQDQANAAQRQAAVRSMLVQYGAVPSGVSDPYGDLQDPHLAALAASNPYSAQALATKQYQGNVANMIGNRVARGVIGSGGTTAQNRELGFQYGQQNYNNLNTLLGNIGQQNQGYAQNALGLKQQGVQALGDAQQRLIAAGFGPPSGAPPTPQAAAQKTPLWNAYNNPFVQANIH